MQNLFVVRLFVNGTLQGQGSDRTFYASSQKMYLIVGNYGYGSFCPADFSRRSQFFGSVDEIRVFSRDLTYEDICALASIY